MPPVKRLRSVPAAAVGLLALASPGLADIQIDLGRGPVNVHTPPSYDPGTPTPLVLLLHGYTASGAGVEAYLQFTAQSDAFGFLYAHPDGTTDGFGFPFWNATPACCGFGSTVDDSGYLRSLIEEIRVQLNVDPDRVWIAGHSNGGFMSYRMACDHADLIAAIASFAGATYDDPADCQPSEPVHVLQIHGTGDATVLYAGGSFSGNPYPGAVRSAETWAAYDGCTLVQDTTQPNVNLIATLPGAETTVTRYVDACQAGGSAELWTNSAGHTPAIASTFAQTVVQWFYAHPKASSVGAPTSPARPTTVTLRPGHPNPFTAFTSLEYELPGRTTVAVDVVDVLGRRVRTLLAPTVRAPGTHVVGWDGRSDAARPVASGTYFVRLRTGGETLARKVQLLGR